MRSREYKMPGGFSRFKPGATKRGQLLFSALLWSALGLFLVLRGIGYLSGPVLPQAVVPVLGLVAGTVKSRLFLDQAAYRTRDRIQGFDDGTCLGAVYSLKTWGLVLIMAFMGVLLRNSSLPGMLLCFILIAVGWSLLLSGRIVWMAWLRSTRQK